MQVPVTLCSSLVHSVATMVDFPQRQGEVPTSKVTFSWGKMFLENRQGEGKALSPDPVKVRRDLLKQLT